MAKSRLNTSVRSKSSSVKRVHDQAAELEMDVEKYKRLSRPLSREAMAEAERLADAYSILIERHDDGLFYGRGIEYPYLMGHGKTPAAAYKMARAGMVGAIASDIAAGDPPPPPATEKRTLQVNVRVSPLEKLRMEEIARRKGFRGVGDFLRNAALTAGD